MIISVPSYSTPSEVHAEEGQVLVEGPDGVAVSLTADAADETAQRLQQAAQTARRQMLRAKSADGEER